MEKRMEDEVETRITHGNGFGDGQRFYIEAHTTWDSGTIGLSL